MEIQVIHIWCPFLNRDPTTMAQVQKQEYSEDEIEEIMDMQAPREFLSARELREAIRENPLLFAGLAFALGLLIGVSFCSGRKSR